CTDTDGYW
nr:immunoglobulin heavy chain junction region [Mus musculus]MBK4197646.1 immunoglobulin heavy chain junction region [Mus musculus]MBK4197647.1 immunoglobulin heavy chain junction region [Mus musculus]